MVRDRVPIKREKPLVVQVVTARELADFAIEHLERRAAFARSVASAYAADTVGPEVAAQITIDDGLSAMLRRLRQISAVDESDLPSGKSHFASKIRWEFARQLLQIFVSPVRDAYALCNVPQPQENVNAA